MKNNKWIKALICLVVVFVIFYMLKNNVPAKAVGKLSSKQDEYLKIKNNYENMSDNFKKKKYYEDSVEKLLEEINDLNVLTDIKQEQIIEILNENISNCKIEATSINFSEVIPVRVNNTNNYEAVKSEEATNENAAQNAVMISVQIEFKSSYDNMLKFVDELKSSSINIVIDNMRVYMDKDNVYGVMDLSIYAVPLDVDV